MCLSSPPYTFPYVPKYLLQVLHHFWVTCSSSLLLSSFPQNTQITLPLSLSFSQWSAPVTLSLVLSVSSHAVTLSLALSVPSPVLPNQNPNLKKHDRLLWCSRSHGKLLQQILFVYCDRFCLFLS